MTSSQRRGAMIFELCASLALLTLAMAGVAQLLQLRAVAERRMTERSRMQQELANLMEQTLALSWEDLTAERTQQLVNQVKARVNTCEFDVQLSENTEAPTAKRIEITVHSNNDTSQAVTTMRLVSWRYRDAGNANAEAVP